MLDTFALEHQLTGDEQVAFLHIPKTAGTTFGAIVEQHFSRQEICPFLLRHELLGTSQQVLDQCDRYRYFHGHLPYGILGKLMRRSPVFITMLRHPVDRLVSQFFFHQQKPGTVSDLYPAADVERFCRMTLAEFTDSTDQSLNMPMWDLQARFLAATFDADTIEEWYHRFDDESGRCARLDTELGKQRLNEFAFVGLAERFQNSLFLLAYTFGWPPVIEYHTLNVTANKPKLEAIPRETLDRIAERNAADMEVHQFAQRLFEDRFARMARELLERYGGAQHAHMQPPLSTEVVSDLLERHYERRYSQRYPLVHSVSFTFDQALSGREWYGPEGQPGGGFRWTGPGTRSSLDLPLTAEAGNLEIKFSAVATATPAILPSLTLKVNNRPVALRKHLDGNGGATIFEGRIPQATLAAGRGFARLTFEVERTVAPCTLDPASTDDRPLGVALSRLEIQPMEEGKRHDSAGMAAGSAQSTGERHYLKAQERIGLLEAAFEGQPRVAAPAAAAAPQAPKPAADEAEQGVEDAIHEGLERVARRYRELTGRELAILDWNTGLQLRQKLPAHNIFSPSVPDAKAVLPYLDDSIDIVICPSDDPAFMDEAIRVARVAAIASNTEARWKIPAGALPPSPSASIVIPVYNHVEQTANCLEQLRRTLPHDFGGEVIVVDDGSTDETPDRLAEWAAQERSLRIVRNPENAGFVASCNAGAGAATGEIVVFLNNDTLPQPGWLEALLHTFRDHPDAGAVGGKLIYPDGRLQEAGGLVFSDGSGANFGKGRDPNDPLYSYVREVDYCSGALLATRRSLFLEWGGFDTDYRPAYYEDTDYCFRVREKGYRVYYQPESRVIHVEGATCGTDLSAGTKQFQVANRAVFVKKWSGALKQQPPRPSRFDLAAWHALAVRGEGEGAEER